MRHFCRWDEVSSTGETNDFLLEVARRLCARINSRTTREFLLDRIDHGDLLALCNFTPVYSELSVSDCLNVRQVTAFFQKRGDLELGVDRAKAAIDSFKEAEELCRKSNEIFRLRADGLFQFPPDVESVLHRTSRKISQMMGPVPDLSELKLRFGPGATTQVVKRKASVKRKLSERLACSESLIPYLSPILEELPLWVDFQATVHNEESWVVPVDIHRGKIRLVPKSWKTDRTIAVEPMLNQMVQLGINDHLCARFEARGLDLSDQSVNQRLAREGSITNALATLDLSSASDTVSTGLVLDLLPWEWFCLLDPLRSQEVEFDGQTLALEKFSSMGNGFTFPLESIIFYSLAASCCKEEDIGFVSVFGDDIIVPTYAYDLLVKVLTAVGFIPNLNKSFADGPFRESCGADWHSGINIRPLYIKGPLALFDIFRIHNWFARRYDDELSSFILSIIPKDFRIFGPDGYGDGHLVGDGGLRPHGRDRGWSGYTFETFTRKPKKDFSVLPGDRVYPFYATYSGSIEDRGFTPHRGGTFGVSIPGAEGVNRIKIYTVSPSA